MILFHHFRYLNKGSKDFSLLPLFLIEQFLSL